MRGSGMGTQEVLKEADEGWEFCKCNTHVKILKENEH